MMMMNAVENSSISNAMTKPGMENPLLYTEEDKYGFLEFVSIKKTVRRIPERILTFTKRATGGDKYKFTSAFYENENVDETWVYNQLSNLPSSLKSNDKISIDTTFDKENTSPQLSQTASVVTPVEDGIKKRKINQSSPHTAMKAMRSAASPDCDISAAAARELAKAFFAADLNPFVEGGVKKEKTKTTTTKNKGEIAAADQFKPILVSIEGNIGAGKSFLLSKIREEHPEWVFIDEPVEFWESLKNEASESLLQVFYKDQRRWSYTFQNCALLSRYQNIESCINSKRAAYEAAYEKQLLEELEKESFEESSQESATTMTHTPPTHGSTPTTTPTSTHALTNKDEQVKVFITERCLDTDREVFAKMLHSDGMLDGLEMELYNRWFSMLLAKSTTLSAIVYVDTVPDLCSQRIGRRARDGEGGIPIEYLNNLHTFQNKWINSTTVPVVRTLSDDLSAVETFIDRLICEAKATLS